MANVTILKPKSPTEKVTRTVVDTILVTPKILEQWQSPPFQRPVRENEKVRALAEKMKTDGGVLPGILTLGVVNGVIYKLDGQHRIAAFLISGLEEGYTDIRTHYFNSMAEMGREFVLLNSQLVRMRPDDILRGLEPSLPALARIRDRCPFIGYDMIRRNPHAPLVSMSAILRCWKAGMLDVPATTGTSAQALAETLTVEEADLLCDFTEIAMEGFGKDQTFARLWGALNLSLCMWLYRRMVITQYSTKTPKLTKELFRKCLMSVAANSLYLDWLVGRSVSERDRSPAYHRIRSSFVERLHLELKKKIAMPSPAWFTGM